MAMKHSEAVWSIKRLWTTALVILGTPLVEAKREPWQHDHPSVSRDFVQSILTIDCWVAEQCRAIISWATEQSKQLGVVHVGRPFR